MRFEAAKLRMLSSWGHPSRMPEESQPIWKCKLYVRRDPSIRLLSAGRLRSTGSCRLSV